MPYPTIWLSQDAVETMAAEATRAAPNETGGMLLGWENPDRNEIVVLAVLGPGPAATHGPASFHPDGGWQQGHLTARYEQSGGLLTYLGDWHVHPTGGFALSRRDRRTMAKTASHAEARCPRPLMALLAREDDRYRLGVWVWEPSWLHPICGRAIPLPMRTWIPSAEERTLSGVVGLRLSRPRVSGRSDP
jgi:integrative and conjugative element protein (TIGR02256 family)